MGEEALPPAEAVDVGDGLLKVWPSGPAREMNALLDSAQRYLEEEECKVCLTEVEGGEERQTILERWRPRVEAAKSAWLALPLEDGMHVELHSLSREELNGRCGFCLGGVGDNGRIGVLLHGSGEAGGDDKPGKLIRPENLRRAPPAPRADRVRAKELAVQADLKLKQARRGAVLGPMGQPSEPTPMIRALIEDATALADSACVADPACVSMHGARVDISILQANRKRQAVHARRGITNGTQEEDAQRVMIMRMALASALGELGNMDGAIEQCRFVLTANPSNLQARVNLGMSLLENRNPKGGSDEEACKHLLMAVDSQGQPGGGPPAFSDSLREMALEDLLHAYSRRMVRHEDDGDEEGRSSVEAQVKALMERMPDAVRRCTARSQARARGEIS